MRVDRLETASFSAVASAARASRIRFSRMSRIIASALKALKEATTAADPNEVVEAFFEFGIHGVGAFQPAKIGMLFGQRIVDNVSPEKQEQRLGVGAREADREAAAAVDEEVSGGVQGECFGADGKAASAGKKGQDTGAGDMFGAGVCAGGCFGQERMIGETRGRICREEFRWE